jgi:hypothetical protein
MNQTIKPDKKEVQIETKINLFINKNKILDRALKKIINKLNKEVQKHQK